MMASKKLNFSVFLASSLVSLICFPDALNNGELWILIPIIVCFASACTFADTYGSFWDSLFVRNEYAYAPEGYNDEDPLRGLIPEFELVDPSEPIFSSRQS